MKRLLQQICETARLMVGQPNYEVYCAHMAEHHPDQPVMDRTAFFREREEARFGSRGGGRCC